MSNTSWNLSLLGSNRWRNPTTERSEVDGEGSEESMLVSRGLDWKSRALTSRELRLSCVVDVRNPEMYQRVLYYVT